MTIPDAIGTLYHVASEQGEISAGDAVLVLGAGGGVGIHMVQVAEYFGGSVTAVDINDEKLEVCADLGVARTVNTSTNSLTKSLGSVPPDVVDFTGDMNLVKEALNLLRPRGRLVNLTTFPGRHKGTSAAVNRA